MADVCYDTLDYEQQYERYIENLKIVDVSIVADRNQSSLSNQGVAESQSGSTGKTIFNSSIYTILYYLY